MTEAPRASRRVCDGGSSVVRPDDMCMESGCGVHGLLSYGTKIPTAIELLQMAFELRWCLACQAKNFDAHRMYWKDIERSFWVLIKRTNYRTR
jgi:hypothetical protein